MKRRRSVMAGGALAVVLAPLLLAAQEPRPLSALPLRFVADTTTNVTKHGTIVTAGARWQCSGRRCTAQGTAKTFSVGNCQELARQVGALNSYGDGTRFLDQIQLKKCNQAVWRAGEQPNAQQFAVDAEAAAVRFGDGVHGRRPESGSAAPAASYRQGAGSRAQKVTPSVATRGGSAPETVESAETAAPGNLRHRDRSVTQQDFQEMDTTPPGVQRASGPAPHPRYRPPSTAGGKGNAEKLMHFNIGSARATLSKGRSLLTLKPATSTNFGARRQIVLRIQTDKRQFDIAPQTWAEDHIDALFPAQEIDGIGGAEKVALYDPVSQKKISNTVGIVFTRQRGTVR